MTQINQILDFAKQCSFFRARDASDRGIRRTVLRRMLQAGQLRQVSRGVYALTQSKPTAYHSFAEAGALVPNGVICLLSALRFHQLTTQAPREIWMAIGVSAWKPRIDTAPIRIVRFSGAALEKGVEFHRIEGVDIKVYGVAKTVADCFKYRNKIGVDVALEALKESLRARKATVAQIGEFATICRVSNVMRPYLEALLS